MPPELRHVYSTMVNRIGYDADAAELHVEFRNGRHAIYHEVPAEVARDVLSAPSIGQALSGAIRGKFHFTYPERRHG